MAIKSLARGSATRTANKNKRRSHILACAGQIIATQGMDALTLSKLAKKADVTVPTIHNLIGKKSDIYRMLVEEMLTRVDEALTATEITDPIEAAETTIDKLMELFSRNEALYKAAYVVGERDKLFEHDNPNGIFRKSLGITIRVCEIAKTSGYLEGKIDTSLLAHEIFGCQRLARYDWIQGYIDLKEYRTQALSGMFIAMAADATPAYRERLRDKIDALSQLGHSRLMLERSA